MMINTTSCKNLVSKDSLLQRTMSISRFLSIVIFLSFLFVNHVFPAILKSNIDDSLTIVEKLGNLKVAGRQVQDQYGNPVVLRGMSLFWSQWMGQYYNYNCIKWLRDDWKCTVVRAAMGVEQGGYLSNPAVEKEKIKTVIDACIDLGIYVIVDWHDHYAEKHTAESINFFKEIADEYGKYPNVIYEIYNEPWGPVSWLSVVKPYADSVVSNIRAIDSDNLILVGSPNWSQDVDVAAKNPLKFSNIVYTLHYYAATHKQTLRNKATSALNKGVAIFVSEFGTCESSGSGVLDSNETKTWFNFLETNKISWCNWALDNKDETSAALKSTTSSTFGWTDADLSASGKLIKDRLIAWKDTIYTDLNFKNISENIPADFQISQNYPNPFNPRTVIGYEIAKNGQVNFDVYDLNGRKIRSLYEGFQAKGHHSITWDGNTDAGIKASSGVYFFHFRFDNQIKVLKGILLN